MPTSENEQVNDVGCAGCAAACPDPRFKTSPLATIQHSSEASYIVVFLLLFICGYSNGAPPDRRGTTAEPHSDKPAVGNKTEKREAQREKRPPNERLSTRNESETRGAERDMIAHNSWLVSTESTYPCRRSVLWSESAAGPALRDGRCRVRCSF